MLDVDVRRCPGARGSATLAATTVTSAPRRAASSASAQPIRPERAVADEAHGVDRLARAAGGDEHLAARRAARRRPRRGAPRRRPAARPARAGGRRPTRPASRARRCRARAPRRRGRAASSRFACVAGCSYIASFIAGATISGRRQASAAAVSRLSARPCGELGDRVGRRRRDQESVGVARRARGARAARARAPGRRGRRRAAGRAPTR